MVHVFCQQHSTCIGDRKFEWCGELNAEESFEDVICCTGSESASHTWSKANPNPPTSRDGFVEQMEADLKTARDAMQDFIDDKCTSAMLSKCSECSYGYGIS